MARDLASKSSALNGLSSKVSQKFSTHEIYCGSGANAVISIA